MSAFSSKISHAFKAKNACVLYGMYVRLAMHTNNKQIYAYACFGVRVLWFVQVEFHLQRCRDIIEIIVFFVEIDKQVLQRPWSSTSIRELVMQSRHGMKGRHERQRISVM
jgi:hypothetical protein